MADAPLLGGTAKDSVSLDDVVFGAPFNGPLVHECVIAELAARRRGTASTKTHSIIRSSGTKP
jgi:large subunit ribosomal protein L4